MTYPIKKSLFSLYFILVFIILFLVLPKKAYAVATVHGQIYETINGVKRGIQTNITVEWQGVEGLAAGSTTITSQINGDTAEYVFGGTTTHLDCALPGENKYYLFTPEKPQGAGHWVIHYKGFSLGTEFLTMTGDSWHTPIGEGAWGNSGAFEVNFEWVHDAPPPENPTITSANATCQGTLPVISLNWSGGANTGYFKVLRWPEVNNGSNTLANFLTSITQMSNSSIGVDSSNSSGTIYANTVNTNATYTYVVRAMAPGGSGYDSNTGLFDSNAVSVQTPACTPPSLPTLKVGQGQNTTTQNPGFYLRSSGKLDSESGTNFQNDIAIMLDYDQFPANASNYEYYVSFYRQSINVASSYEDLLTKITKPEDGFIIRYVPQNNAGNQYQYYNTDTRQFRNIQPDGQKFGFTTLYTIFPGPTRNKDISWRVAFEKQFTRSSSGSSNTYLDTALHTSVFIRDIQTGLSRFEPKAIPQAP